VTKVAPGSPACAIEALLPGPPTQLQVLIHADRGLSGLLVTQASNATVTLPSFTPGSSTDGDPALVTVGRESGDSPVQVIHHVARTESHVTITNGTPGVGSVRLEIHGQRVEATDLHSDQVRTLNVSSAMRNGSDNSIRVVAYGPRGRSAVVLVSDS